MSLILLLCFFVVLLDYGQAALILPVCGWVCQLLTEAGPGLTESVKHGGMETP